MNNDQMTCDSERIERFLGQNLSDHEQTAFEDHLDDCDDCRRRLEAAAAGEDVWAGVRESLSDGSVLSDLSAQSALDSATGEDVAFSHDAVLKLLAPTDDDRMIGRLGTYEVVGVIGSGGMGVVLKAFDAALNRYVAIKVLAPHFGCSGAARKRFRREAQSAAAVVHENVIEIHSVADADGLPYLVMPYLRGPSLQRRLDDEGALAVVEILRIAKQTAAGLAAAHVQGLVHRDVKPANILLADGVERVKLTDFGLARAADDASLTKTGIIAGTGARRGGRPAERLIQPGERVVRDVHRPRTVPRRNELRRAETHHRRRAETNPEVPDWLCRIVGRLMSKEPDDRFESADEVAELLEQCLAHVQQPTAVPLPKSRVFEGPTSAGSRRPPIFKRLVGAAFAFAAIFAGIVIVLELNKGKLTIECEADDVPVRIMRGDTVVEKLTVTRSGASVRVAAGVYVVEIDGRPDGITIKDGTVTLQRGGRAVVKIVKRDNETKTAGSGAHSQTVKNLERLMVALHKYHDAHRHFPPAVVVGNTGKGEIPHSWRIELLPFLGEKRLYDRYRFNEKWDSKHNKSLLPLMPSVFRSPRDKPDSTNTSYFGVISTDVRAGREGADSSAGPPGVRVVPWPVGMTFFWRSHGCRFVDIHDGTSNTIAVVEAKRDVPWTKPEDIMYAADKPLPKFGGWFSEGWHAGFADGKVKFLAADNDERTIRSLITIRDGRPAVPKIVKGSGKKRRTSKPIPKTP